MHRIFLVAAATLAIVGTPVLAESDPDTCPSGQVNTAPAGSPAQCAIDSTATTPAPDVVEDAAEVVKDAGAAVKDAGEAVVDTVTDAVQ